MAWIVETVRGILAALRGSKAQELQTVASKSQGHVSGRARVRNSSSRQF